MNVPTFSATYEGKFGNMGSMMVVIPGVWVFWGSVKICTPSAQRFFNSIMHLCHTYSVDFVCRSQTTPVFSMMALYSHTDMYIHVYLCLFLSIQKKCQTISLRILGDVKNRRRLTDTPYSLTPDSEDQWAHVGLAEHSVRIIQHKACVEFYSAKTVLDTGSFVSVGIHMTL